MKKMIFVVFASVFFLSFCSSQEISCTVDVTSGGTRYRVPEFTASRCLYSWSNETNLVLATKDGKLDELVVSSNITEVVTYKCCEVIKYRRSCVSEMKTTTATCRATCTGTVEDQNEEGKTNDRKHITWVVVPALLLLLLVITISMMLYRKKIRRTMTDTAVYTGVNKTGFPGEPTPHANSTHKDPCPTQDSSQSYSGYELTVLTTKPP